MLQHLFMVCINGVRLKIMRAALLGLAASVIAGQAVAADYLRGSTYEYGPKPKYRWDGWYVGGQGGFSNTDYEFGSTTRPLAANVLRNLRVEAEGRVSTWPSLPNRDTRGASYGGFIGYNAQWGDVVLGVEANYNFTNQEATSTDAIARRLQFGNDDGSQSIYNVALVSQARSRVTDFGSLRFRAGYAMDWIMPYMMAGLSVGRINYSRSVHVVVDESIVQQGQPPVPAGFIDTIASDGRNGAIAVGYMAGAGVDLALTHNLFLRAEYEFVQLAKVGGIAHRINTIRGAAALKF
jgi:outer membrane immunogenic protein